MKPITREDVLDALHAFDGEREDFQYGDAADRVWALLHEHGRECRYHPAENEPDDSLNGYLAEADGPWGRTHWRHVLVLNLKAGRT